MFYHNNLFKLKFVFNITKMTKKYACLHDRLKGEGWIAFDTTIPSGLEVSASPRGKRLIPKTPEEEKNVLSYLIDIELPLGFVDHRYDNFKIIPTSISLEGHPVKFSDQAMQGHIIYVHPNPSFKDEGLVRQVYVDKARGKTAYRL
jgi:hypothetical protein